MSGSYSECTVQCQDYKVDHSSDVRKKVSDSWLMDSRGIMCELKNEQMAEFKLPWQLNLQQKLLIWHKYSAIRLKAERFSSFFVS